MAEPGNAAAVEGLAGEEKQDGGGGDFKIRFSFRRVAFRLNRACRFDLPSIPLERHKNGIESSPSRYLQIAEGKVT